MKKGKIFMKVLKVDSKKGYYSIDGITYNSIVDISKENDNQN